MEYLTNSDLEEFTRRLEKRIEQIGINFQTQADNCLKTHADNCLKRYVLTLTLFCAGILLLLPALTLLVLAIAKMA